MIGGDFGPIKSLVDVKHVHSFDRIGVLAVNNTLETQTMMKLIGPTSVMNSPDLAASSIVDVTHTHTNVIEVWHVTPPLLWHAKSYFIF